MWEGVDEVHEDEAGDEGDAYPGVGFAGVGFVGFVVGVAGGGGWWMGRGVLSEVFFGLLESIVWAGHEARVLVALVVVICSRYDW